MCVDVGIEGGRGVYIVMIRDAGDKGHGNSTGGDERPRVQGTVIQQSEEVGAVPLIVCRRPDTGPAASSYPPTVSRHPSGSLLPPLYLQVPKGRSTKEDVFCPVLRVQGLERTLPRIFLSRCLSKL